MVVDWQFTIIVWAVCIGIGAAISNSKNRGYGEGAVLGGLLGLIGVVIAACLSKQLPKAPAGMIAVQCARCTAMQNVPFGQSHYDCWQCHTPNAAPGFEGVPQPTSQTRRVRCFKCETVQTVPANMASIPCESCKAPMKLGAG